MKNNIIDYYIDYYFGSMSFPEKQLCISLIFLLLFVCFLLIIIIVMKKNERQEKEKKALQEIKIGMTKKEVDNILGNSILEKQTKKYEQYKYLETNKISNISYSINNNLRGGRIYTHNKKSYISIKYSNDEKKVIEIINKL